MGIHQIRLLLVGLVAVGLGGCSSSSSILEPFDDAVTDLTEILDANTDINIDTDIDIDTGTDTGTGTTTGIAGNEPTGNGSVTSIGDNPGVIRTPVLAELSTINLQDLGGHVVYAGPEEVFFEGYSYVNVDFACDGTGTFELFPAADFAAFLPIVRGTSAWRVSADGEDVSVDITRVTEGAGGMADFDGDNVSVNPVSGGTLIAGEATLQSKIVANILQYEECN